MRLINRRFVPFAFDLSAVTIDTPEISMGALCDASARRFVLEHRPELEGESVSTPPVLVLTPDGELLAEIDNYSTEDAFFAALRDLLRDHPEWNTPAATETAAMKQGEGSAESLASRAELETDLGNYELALGELSRALLHECDPTKRLTILCQILHVAYLGRDDRVFRAVQRSLGEASQFIAAAAIDVAQWRCRTQDFRGVLAALDGVDGLESDEFRSEARYLTAVARFGIGEREQSRALLQAILADPVVGPWTYRADWALFSLDHPTKSSFSTSDAKTCLGRLGYMGRLNPDFPRSSDASDATPPTDHEGEHH